jgi:DNA (cytosine-5)-methyltransferase 1
MAFDLDTHVTEERPCGPLLVALGEYSEDGSASTMKHRDYKDATDLVYGVRPVSPTITGNYGKQVGSSNTSNDPNVAIALAGNMIGRAPENGGNGSGCDESGASYTLTKTDVHAVAYRTNPSGEVMRQNGVCAALTTFTDATAQFIQRALAVRRLTPTECARLQGFPDEYLSQVPGANDTQMYRAFGNSMAVNVMQAIGERINLIEGGRV